MRKLINALKQQIGWFHSLLPLSI